MAIKLSQVQKRKQKNINKSSEKKITKKPQLPWHAERYDFIEKSALDSTIDAFSIETISKLSGTQEPLKFSQAWKRLGALESIEAQFQEISSVFRRAGDDVKQRILAKAFGSLARVRRR